MLGKSVGKIFLQFRTEVYHGDTAGEVGGVIQGDRAHVFGGTFLAHVLYQYFYSLVFSHSTESGDSLTGAKQQNICIS